MELVRKTLEEQAWLTLSRKKNRWGAPNKSGWCRKKKTHQCPTRGVLETPIRREGKGTNVNITDPGRKVRLAAKDLNRGPKKAMDAENK